jgi:hypothetical protein
VIPAFAALLRRVAALALLALALAPLAQAATHGPVFGLRALGNPKLGYFVYDLTPGATKSGAIIVSNTGDRTGTVKLYAADATTGRTTGTVYLTNHAAFKTGAWVKLATNSLRLAPGRHATVPFTVRVPAGAKPGQWVAGIVAETTQAAQGPAAKHKANVRIRIRNLTIVAVQVNLPGAPVVSFTIGGVSTGGQHGFQQVIVHFANAGNLLRKPHGTVTILDSTSRVVEKLTYAMDTFLPQTSIDYPLLLKKALPPGDYQAVVRISAPGTGAAGALKEANATRSFTVSKQDVTQVFTSSQPTQTPAGGLADSSSSSPPWALIAAAAIGALLLALLIFQLVRRRRTPPAERVEGSAFAAPGPVPFPQRSEPAPRASPPVAPPAPPVEPVAPVEPLAPVEHVAPVEPLAPFARAPLARAPVAPAPPAPAPPSAPVAPAVSAACDPHHFWEVAYDRGQLGSDGVWRFPHRCRQCGLELLAADIADASAQASTHRATG